MRMWLPKILLLLSGLLLAACTPHQNQGLQGVVQFDGQPLAGVQLAVYLQSSGDRTTQPFATAVSDGAGRYRLELPPGRYYLVAKKRQTDASGHSRMLMAECPTNPLRLTDAPLEVPGFSLREMGQGGRLVADPGTGIGGRLLSAGKPLSGAYVYVYLEDAAGLRGPSYGEAVATDADGRFRVELPAGSYYLAARKRADGARFGELQPGDLNGDFAANPVRLAIGQTRQLPDWSLTPVDAKVRAERFRQGRFAYSATGLAGRAVDEQGRPAAGIYVYAYLDSRMVGKPSYISAPTGADGRFRVNLGEAGRYYIGARSTYGGPLEPGERVGTFDGKADHRAEVKAGKTLALGDIVVREVW